MFDSKKHGLVSCTHILCAVVALGSLGRVSEGAVSPFAGEDFDGGATNGGLTALTSVFTPDNSGSQTRGSFGASFFDRFGEVSRIDAAGAGLPFNLLDDSLPGFPQSFQGDMEGFVAADKLDDFVLLADTTNAQNPAGTVSAEWTFEVLDRRELVLSVDFGMLGRFEEEDTIAFTYSFDGGVESEAFVIAGAPGVPYSYEMDNGAYVDRFFNSFFSRDDWDNLVSLGPVPGDFDYHPLDNGLDGDTLAEDGLIPVEFSDGVQDVRAILDITLSGSFANTESLPTQGPLVLTSGDGSLTEVMIPADFTTFSTALSGVGSTLTLRLEGVTNGGNEFFAFDNLILAGRLVPEPATGGLAALTSAGWLLSRRRTRSAG